jgi:tetratricopeptide (TPR) repeat protein
MPTREDLESYILPMQHQLRLARATGDPQQVLVPLFYLAVSFDLLGRYEEATPLLEEVLPLARAAGDREKEKIALMGMAGALTHLGRYHDALPRWQEALLFARAQDDGEFLAEALSSYGYALMQADLPGQALPLLQEALDLTRKAEGKRLREANTLNTLGVVLSALGRAQEAMATYEQALYLAHQEGDTGEQALILGSMGNEYLEHLGQPQQAVIVYRKALTLFRTLGDRPQEAQTLYHLGRAYLLRGSQLAQAERALQQGRRLATELGELGLAQRILEALSEVMAKGGRINDAVAFARQGRDLLDPREALSQHREAREHARERGDTRAEAYHLGEMATALGTLDYRADAVTANLDAVPLFRRVEDRHGEGICFINLGIHCFLLDSYTECLACWLRALVLLEGEQSADEEQLRRKLAQAEQHLGRRTFEQFRNASLPLLLQLEAPDADLQALFAPILLLARETDHAERMYEED